MSVETNVRISDLPPNAAIRWIERLLEDAQSISEIRGMMAFCRKDCQSTREILAQRGVPPDSAEYKKIDQILYHLNNRAWRQNEALTKLDAVCARIRQRVSENHG